MCLRNGFRISTPVTAFSGIFSSSLPTLTRAQPNSGLPQGEYWDREEDSDKRVFGRYAVTSFSKPLADTATHLTKTAPRCVSHLSQVPQIKELRRLIRKSAQACASL
jgi:hypothetical protein